MNKFNQDNRSDRNKERQDFAGRNFGGHNREFGSRGANRPMHQTVCGKCGKNCEVPFKPTGDRPVFCNDCFRKERQGNAERHTGENFGRPNFDERQKQRIAGSQNAEQFKSQFDILNAKLDKILKALTPNISTIAAPGVVETKEIKKTSKKATTKKKK